MAILNYTEEVISALKPEEGELFLFNFLKDNLDDSYEIYFQPHLNGDRPDIVLMRKDYGVLVIEAKNWCMDSHDFNQLYGKNTPASQVKKYKENLYNLHIKNLSELTAVNKDCFNIVRCALYFHNSTETESMNKLQEYDMEYKNNKNDYIVLGKDSLNKEKLIKILKLVKLEGEKFPLFTNELYIAFKNELQASENIKEQCAKLAYNSEQKEIINKIEPKQQKIKGVVGSGKTLILAQRAVNAYKRLGGEILILHFNISLKNYIFDKISAVKENIPKYKEKFIVQNYHNFFNIQANNLELKVKSKDDCENIDFFESEKEKIKKYNAIFIDEVQDFQVEWIRIIKKYFLANNAEFIVFGDEKQNIFNKPLGDIDEPKMPNTTIPGRWNRRLIKSYRLSQKISSIAKKFQESFFIEKYGLDKIEIEQRQIEFNKPNCYYIYYESTDPSSEVLSQYIVNTAKKLKINFNDICILSSKIEPLRDVDFFIRKNSGFTRVTKTTFEDKETYEILKEENKDKNKKELRDILEGIGRGKKYHFYMNPGCIKISTIHSFKGWEIPTLFLIINQNEQPHDYESVKVGDDIEVKRLPNHELIYTGLTRTMKNLFIINIGNKDYHDFFKSIKDKFDVYNVLGAI